MSMYFCCCVEDSKHNVCIEHTMCGKCLAAGPLCNWCSKEVLNLICTQFFCHHRVISMLLMFTISF